MALEQENIAHICNIVYSKQPVDAMTAAMNAPGATFLCQLEVKAD
jgi:hypothetical protein